MNEPWKRKEVIGNAELYLGDCLLCLPHLPKVDAVITSPPYNTLHQIGDCPTGMWAKTNGGAGWVKSVAERSGYIDDMPENEYISWQNRIFEIINCADDASLFYNHQIRWRDRTVSHPIQWFHPKGWNLRQEIVWARSGGMMMNARMFCRTDERILWFARDNWKWNQEHVGLGTVWRMNQGAGKFKEHPVSFPIELPTRCIAATTDGDSIVLDPFMGSGTTGVACVNLGRKFIGVEINEVYFDIACRRIEDAQRQTRLFPEEQKNSGMPRVQEEIFSKRETG